MDRREVFQTWAPKEGWIWTKFAKPVLFTHMEDQKHSKRVYPASIPIDIQKLDLKNTALIVDLPGALGVEVGLGLAREGFRPIPLYNGIQGAQNGDLEPAVDNSEIVNALLMGADDLRHTVLHEQSPPAFLLDSNRDVRSANIKALYDNRWNVGLDDMPTASYLERNGISRIVVWTERRIQEDLQPIIRSYQDIGIELVTYIEGKLEHQAHKCVWTDALKTPSVPIETKEAVRHFENGRFALLIIGLLALFNLIGMFLINEEPLLWTAPTIMWLTYLWIPEIVGDLIAVALTLTYWIIYWQSHRRHGLIQMATIFFGIEVLVLFIYAFYYGFAAYTGYSPLYGLIVFVTPVILLRFLISGMSAYLKIKEISDTDYETALDDIDGLEHSDRHFVPRRRVFRPYRGYGGYGGYGGGSYGSGGYGGYGGTGRGGYGGGGYGGYGGFGG